MSLRGFGGSTGFPGDTPVTSSLPGGAASQIYPPTVPLVLRSSRETVISAFQSGHGYTKSSGGGTVSDDTTMPGGGIQSLKVVSDGTGGATAISKTSISPTIDLSAKFLKLLVWIDDPSKIVELSVMVSQDNFTNFAKATVVPQSVNSPLAGSWILGGAWYTATLSRGDFTGTGTVTWNAINAIRLRTADTGSGNICTVWFGALTAVPDPPDGGMLSIVFDDGAASVYSTALPILHAQRAPATLYVICDEVDGAGTNFNPTGALTTAQLTDLRDHYGWEIGAHAFNNTAGTQAHNLGYDGISLATAEQDMQRMRQYLIARGARSLDHLALPHGTWNESVRQLAKRYFSSVRTVFGHGATQRAVAETFPPADPHRLRAWQVNSTDDPTTALLAAVDKAATNKEWLILLFHQIVASPTSTSTHYSTANFTTFVNGLASRSIAVRTVGDALRQRVG